MSIIEKLGIKMPFDGNEGCYLYAEREATKIIVNMETNKLLWAATGMLDALIESTLELADHYGYGYSTVEDNISIIEKATGESWEDIKKLIN